MIDFSDLEIELIDGNEKDGTFRIGPLPRGYGHTFANPLRRILLSSLPGGGITSLKISGVDHEYSTVKGVKETMLNIMLNLKAIRFKVDSDEPQTVKLSVKGAKTVTAKDLDVTESVKVMNPEVVIATLTSKDAKLDLELTVERGTGYRAANEEVRSEAGRLPLDASFSPVERVSFDIESARKGEKTNLDAILLKIYTDGSITPKDALVSAVQVFDSLLHKFEDLLGAGVKEAKTEKKTVEPTAEGKVEGEILEWPIENLPVSQRVKSALIAAKVMKVNDLVQLSGDDILNLPGIGAKALGDINKFLKEYNLELKK